MIKNKPKILFIGTDYGGNKYRTENNAPGAVSQYRLINPIKHLEEFFDIDYQGADFANGSEGVDTAKWYKDKFEPYDLVVSKLTDNDQAASCIRFMTEHLEIPLIVDIDDNIWEIKNDNPNYEFYRKGAKKLATSSTYLSLANYVWTSTQPLSEYVQGRLKDAYNKDMDVSVLPNCINPTDFDFKKTPLDSNKIVIGWQGSTTHHEDLKVAMPAIAKLMKKYDNLHFEIVGGVIADRVSDLFKDFDFESTQRIHMKAGGDAYDTFPKMLSEQAWDIAIAPLTNDEFNRAKSHIKWMEYSMFEIPCVASDVYPYFVPIQGTEVIIDGSTGLIADKNEWYNKLKTLIDNKVLRVKIGENAKKQVLENWDIKKHAYKWKDAIDKVLATRE